MKKIYLYLLFIVLFILKIMDLSITHFAIVNYGVIELNFMGYSWFSWFYTIGILILSGLLIYTFKDKVILKLIGSLFILQIIFSIYIVSHGLGVIFYEV